MTSAYKVSFLKDFAFNTFLREKTFLEKIFTSEKEDIEIAIKLSNEEQIWCLSLILLLIANKDIPLEREAFNKLSIENLNFLKSFKNYSNFQNLIENTREELIVKLLKFSSVFNLLVKPIVKK